MKEIWNLIRCEFIKHFSWKKNIIIIIILILACLGLDLFQRTLGDKRFFSENRYWININNFEFGYNRINEKCEKESCKPEILYQIYIAPYNKFNTIFSKIKELDSKNPEEKRMWYIEAFGELEENTYVEELLNILINSKEDELSELNEWYDKYEYYFEYSAFSPSFMVNIHNYLEQYKEYSAEELQKELDKIKEVNDKKLKALEENKYYLYKEAKYIEYKNEIESGRYENKDTIKHFMYVIDNKVEDEYDYRAINANQFNKLSETYGSYTTNDSVPYMDNNLGYEYLHKTKNGVKKFYKKMTDVVGEEKLITEYAMNHNLKHDLILVDQNAEGYTYNTTKSYMNLGLNLGFVLFIIIAITNSGIMTDEHNKGTIKLLLTKPVNRSKVLASKMLYLIMDLYIWWIIGSIIMMTIGIINCGVADLFTSKLVVVNGNVKEVIYLLWYLKEMIICSIPVIAMLSLIFMMSTLTPSVALTASINSIIGVISISVWFIVATFGVKLLVPLCYTPIPYLDYFLVRYHNLYYMQSIVYTNLSDSYSIIISLITAISLFVLTVLIYNKKDIKN